jgi:hypothetical protein
VNNVPAGRWNAPSGGAQTCHSWAPGGREEQQPISFSAFANQGGGTCQHHPSGPCRTLTFRLPHTHTDHAAPPPLTKTRWIPGIFTFCLLMMTRQIQRTKTSQKVLTAVRWPPNHSEKGAPFTADNWFHQEIQKTRRGKTRCRRGKRPTTGSRPLSNGYAMNPASTPLHHHLVLMGTYSSPPMLHVECAGNLSIGEASTPAFSVLFWEPSARDFSPTSHSLTHSLTAAFSLSLSLLFSSLLFSSFAGHCVAPAG